jgi:transcriptional regulator with XRE-family HTH domain
MTISIRGARADRGLSQSQVADAMGLSVVTYGRIERSPKLITWEQAEQLSEIFGRPIHEFSFHEPEEVNTDGD